MSFPATRFSLIQRLASEGQEDDWRVFLHDYWGPVLRFAQRAGAKDHATAEDITATCFQILWENQLLVRWCSTRTSKLRTLLCAIVKNVLANWGRKRQSERQWLEAVIAQCRDSDVASDQAYPFYTEWVEEMVRQAVEAMAADYYRQGKGNYVRVFFGKLCSRSTNAELAELLRLSASDVDNYFRRARNQLQVQLERSLVEQIRRYTPESEVEREFGQEWTQLGQFLLNHGGLESAVERLAGMLPTANRADFRLQGRAD